MKIIETSFDGYRFRSRTEARWAVFFKSCGIRFEYEKEGYDLGGGVWYLPDFWLPDFDRWFEVKGKRPSTDELDKCRALAFESQSEVLLAIGPPTPDVEQIIRVYPHYEFVVQDKGWRKYRLENWREYPHPGSEYEEGWQFADDVMRDGIFWLDSSEFGASCIGPHKVRGTDDAPKIAYSVTSQGFCEARRERFGR
jgi:hypothetical protein